jgi:hypothetical protein
VTAHERGSDEILGEFADADAMLAALGTLRRRHYRDIETYAPFDLPEVDARLGRRRSRIGWLALAGGIAGLMVSYGIQWWTNVRAYPLDVGGRPLDAAPAFVPATFEGTVLGAALATFVGLLLWLRLPRLWAPVDEIDGFERASVDRFWIAVGAFTSEQDRAGAERLLRDAGAQRTVHVSRR